LSGARKTRRGKSIAQRSRRPQRRKLGRMTEGPLANMLGSVRERREAGESIAQRSRRPQRREFGEDISRALGEHAGFRCEKGAKRGKHRTEITEEGVWGGPQCLRRVLIEGAPSTSLSLPIVLDPSVEFLHKSSRAHHRVLLTTCLQQQQRAQLLPRVSPWALLNS
jgi:hypothetical protein